MKITLAERLLESIDSPDQREIDARWAREAEDRIDAYDRGEIASPIEAAIALSIYVLAVELTAAYRGKRTLAQKAPWAVAGGFGLLHGLGFAGVLAEVGLPTAEIPLALFSFNVGIELGQLAFVAAVLLLAVALRKSPSPGWQWARAVPAYAIDTMATFWFLQRALSLM